MANPDITTLWNIRKEMLEMVLSFFEHFAPANVQDHDANLKKELDLTFQCLQTNPKSYGAWHHRCWSMLKMKNPTWDNEIGSKIKIKPSLPLAIIPKNHEFSAIIRFLLEMAIYSSKI